MVEVGLEGRVAVGDDRVGHPLDALASESETPGDHRDAEPAGRGDPHHLPPRLIALARLVRSDAWPVSGSR